ncbi:unnamed protein product [Adineta steineri]|uniref:Uncharacterized protein n=1 Tax=Adineta steineri TaxID=433720 RepID=A0A813N719_9BILA|nr:unnamed protein product [Adineta steineri]CAF0753485.1 unnamed protein product [Adineta steineri]CAF0807996.1 unnamed protein product [Adineta steineri]CAF0867051.1 unnamed protein product [Adineta steineri]CAF1419592.1 unnamed protein product [Adineta steineri]
MSSPIGFTQRISSMIKLNWLLILAALLFVCCSSINSKSIDVDQSSEHQMIDSFYPNSLFVEDSDMVERAAPRLGRASPRLGRASPRLGRASPRLGRNAAASLHSRLSHAGRYYNGDEDTTNDNQYDIESIMQERRAAPRLGRAV